MVTDEDLLKIQSLVKQVSEQQKEIDRLKEQEFCPDFLIEAYGLKTRVWTFHKSINKYGCAECCTGDRCDEDCKAKYKGRRDECPHCKGSGWIPKVDARLIPIEETLSELSRLREEKKELVEALQSVFELIDAGVLVRDISRDNEPSWAVKQLPMLVSLGKAKSLLSKFEVPNQS